MCLFQVGKFFADVVKVTFDLFNDRDFFNLFILDFFFDFFNNLITVDGITAPGDKLTTKDNVIFGFKPTQYSVFGFGDSSSRFPILDGLYIDTDNFR